MEAQMRIPEVDAYIAAEPEPKQATLRAMHDMIHEIVTDASESLVMACQCLWYVARSLRELPPSRSTSSMPPKAIPCSVSVLRH